MKSLCLVPGKTCWLVYVDALVLNDGGNVLAALSFAARAALALTRVYKVGWGVGGVVAVSVSLWWVTALQVLQLVLLQNSVHDLSTIGDACWLQQFLGA